MKEKLEQRKNELKELVEKYNQTNQILQSFGQEIFKVQGAIAQLEELIKGKVK